MSENIVRHGSIMQDAVEGGITPPDIVDQMTIKHSAPMPENENYRPGGSDTSSGSSGSFDMLIDTVTGKSYKLYVEDSKLTMSEVKR